MAAWHAIGTSGDGGAGGMWMIWSYRPSAGSAGKVAVRVAGDGAICSAEPPGFFLSTIPVPPRMFTLPLDCGGNFIRDPVALSYSQRTGGSGPAR